MAKNLVIFQNYYTPYRAKLFQEIGKHTDLTVVYIHKPDDEGRKWQETELIDGKKKSYTTHPMEYTKIGPVIWPKKIETLKKFINKDTVVVYLDNLPTNISMARITYALRIVPRKQRYLWLEHQFLPEKYGPPIPFFNALKLFYKTTSSWILAQFVEHIIAFSDMSVEYCKKIGLPLYGQDMLRTYQATYTGHEIDSYRAATEKSRSYKPDHIVFGFLGYFTQRKGIATLLSAIQFDKNPHAKFLFIGDGPEKKSILEAAENDSRISHIPYINTEEEKTDIFMQMDVQIIPSDKDPWGLVVNEAAARGVPSIVSPYVGAKELVTKIDTAFVMADNKTLNIAKAFADMTKFHADKKKWDQMVEKTYDTAKEWSIEKAAETFRLITND